MLNLSRLAVFALFLAACPTPQSTADAGTRPDDAGSGPMLDGGANVVPLLLGVFRPDNNGVVLELADGGVTTFHFPGAPFGGAAKLPVSGDFDGDGQATLALYDPDTGDFVLPEEVGARSPTRTVNLGIKSGRPLAGDFDGDGVDTLGVFDVQNATVWLTNSVTPVRASISFSLGTTSDWPFAGDFDGDGVDSIGVYSPSSNRALIRASVKDDTVVTYSFAGLTSVTLPVTVSCGAVECLSIFEPATRRWFGLGQDHALETRAVFGPPGFVVPLAGHWRRTAVEAPRGAAWPTASLSEARIDAVAIDQAIERAVRPTLRGVVVIREGRLVFERSWSATPELAESVQSVSKSFTSALVGIALRDGLIESVDDPVSKYLPEYFVAPSDPRKSRIAIKHLLTMTSGLRIPDEDPTGWAQALAAPDVVGAVLASPMTSEPGTEFGYATGVTHVLGKIIERRAQVSLEAFARAKLFEPLGVDLAGWSFDHNGLALGGSGMLLRPRDLAKLGELFLRAGTLNGTFIVPQPYVTAVTSPQIGVDSVFSYGGQWWLREYAGRGTFVARGHGGQLIAVIPSLELVVVTTAVPNVTFEASNTMLDVVDTLVADVVRATNQ